jgi:translation initiation factor 2 beta subunit (eIF-2beta)/eIF-5
MRTKKPQGNLPESLKICPVCKKPGLEDYMLFRPGMEHRCKFCGYVGPLRLLEEETSD